MRALQIKKSNCCSFIAGHCSGWNPLIQWEAHLKWKSQSLNLPCMDWSRLDLDLTFKKGGPAIGFALTSKTCHYICFFFFCFFGWINLFLEWLITCCFLPNESNSGVQHFWKWNLGSNSVSASWWGEFADFTLSVSQFPNVASPKFFACIPNKKCIKPWGAVWMHKSHQSKVMVLLWCCKGVGWIECTSACCECHIKSKVRCCKGVM